jgi:hypothetical protein
MALREFADDSGDRWEVWDTVPSAPQGNFADTPAGRLLATRPEGSERRGVMPTRFTAGREGGWLTFASGTRRLRLSPIPDGWQACSEVELRSHLARADRVSSAPARIGLTREGR